MVYFVCVLSLLPFLLVGLIFEHFDAFSSSGLVLAGLGHREKLPHLILWSRGADRVSGQPQILRLPGEKVSVKPEPAEASGMHDRFWTLEAAKTQKHYGWKSELKVMLSSHGSDACSKMLINLTDVGGATVKFKPQQYNEASTVYLR